MSELFIFKGCGESEADEEDEGEEEEEFDWQVEQQVYQENSEEELKAMQTYGFGNLRSGVFARLQVSLRVVRATFHLVCRFPPSGDFFLAGTVKLCWLLTIVSKVVARDLLMVTELVSLCCEFTFFDLFKRKKHLSMV